jgi:hypothetical protein
LSTQRIEKGIHSINVNGHIIDFLCQKIPSDNLLVVFGGAARRGPETTPPFFSGIGISANLKCSVMAINDPSFYLDREIRIAWYAGSKNLPLQSILPAIIDKVASECASRIIMTGGSGGGFASLYYATKAAQPSIAVVYNPQTNIRKYHRGHVQDFAKVCFDWREGNVESALSDITFDLVKLYSEKKAPVIYLQNSADYFHIENHAKSFLRVYELDWTGTDQSTEGFYLHVGDWGSKHARPPKELLTSIVRHLCGWELSLNEVVNLAKQEMAQSEKNLKQP